MSGSAFDVIVDEIVRRGPIRFSRFMDLALYAPRVGFYESGGRAGRGAGDFITSPEVGPLFGAIVARWLDAEWERQGRPDPFEVAEAGAGVGTLWRAIHRAGPECLPALRFTLVERSARQRAAHATLPGVARRQGSPTRGARPRSVESKASLPYDLLHVVMANELLDNLVFDVAERTADGWARRLVALDGTDLVFVSETDPAIDVRLNRLVPDAVMGATVPLCGAAAGWVEAACSAAATVLAFDYVASTAELAARGFGGWCRVYRGHGRGSDPLSAPGSGDITTDVAVDQLPPPTTDRRQAEFLAEYGIEALVEAGRATWAERASIGDLAAIEARSRVSEAAALTDPDGLGGFRVLEWRRDLGAA